MNKNFRKYFSIHLEGLDFSCTKPSSAFSLRSTFLLRSLRVFNCLNSEIKKSPIKHKKKGIFASIFGNGGTTKTAKMDIVHQNSDAI